MKSQIITYFKKHPFEILNQKQLSVRLGAQNKIGRGQIDAAMKELVKEKQLEELQHGRYRLAENSLLDLDPQNYVIGTVDMKSTGKAYVLPQKKDLDDIFIASNNTNRSLNGDLVKVFLFPQRKDHKRDGKVVEVVKRNKTKYVGTLKLNKHYGIVICNSKNMPYDIFIPDGWKDKSANGKKVLVEIIEWEQHLNNPSGKILSVLGNAGDNEVEMQSVLVEYDFSAIFPKEVEKAAANITAVINKNEIKKRRDFRDVPTITIDPADAKDFDDALSIRKLDNGNFEIGVHIADVSYYVESGSVIDEEAYKRATSVYLVDRTVPMLPEKLCNGVCSLRPNEDKLCFSAVFEMNDKAEVLSEWFGKTIIHSDRRFAYEEVQNVIEAGKGELDSVIMPLHKIATIMRKERFKAGTIDFHTTEVKFELDENAKPIAVYLKESKEANWLVEEFMLLANKKVAELASKKFKKTFVYRIHDEPQAEKLATFAAFVGKLGHKIKTDSKAELAKSFNKLFENVKGKGEEGMIETIAVRTMSKAIYSTENIGHYGLSFKYYTHFTSPIRRYPDLMVHRLLESYLANGKSVAQAEYENYCEHSSVMEKKAVEAERLSIKYKQAEYLLDRKGQVLEGNVSGVSKYGIFVELIDSHCEGMVSLQSLDDDFYYLDEENYQVLGRRHGQRYRIGDKVKVKVFKVDVSQRRIDFLMQKEK